MAVDRPTFHESWYRAAQLRPRLLSSVQVYRQHFRGQKWYVLENPSTNEFARISPDAYHFIGMLDGRRTIADVWFACNELFGDRAPTQGEVIQLLGQLFCSNLLYAESAPDVESLFNRYRTRVKRQVQGFFSNLLFVRIPLLDPDHFLDRWIGVIGLVFSWVGLALWLTLVATGLYFIIGNMREFIHQSSDVLAPENLVLLYISLVVIKTLHEFGHAFACKKFGRLNGTGGQVHVMGVMFLVFVPLPYMDASSAWAFRKKWQRVIVGSAGVSVELACAAVAAIVWASTSTGTLHIIAYNIVFVASVSTLVFNGNPLLRFDAYYVLSDLIEVPNLSQRSKDYIYYLVKRYCWNLQKAHNPAHSPGEQAWFAFYGIASTAYRVFICVRILLFLNDRLPKELFVLVPFFAGSAIIAWVLVPLGRFFRYLATGDELMRNRGRAVSSALGSFVVLTACFGILDAPCHYKVEGIVEPVGLAIVHAASNGFATRCLPSDREVSPSGESLIEGSNPELEAERRGLLAELRGLEARKRIAEMQEVAAVQMIAEQIEALREKIARVEFDLDSLSLQPTLSGTWISMETDRTKGIYLTRGQQVGLIASLDKVRIRAVAGQQLAAMLGQAFKQLEIRVKGRPDVMLAGEIEEILPAGQDVLPSEALGYAVGGAMPTISQDPSGRRSAEKFFEIRIRPTQDGSVRLLSGQRVVARIQMPSRPLVVQWWRSLRQLFQRRFHV